MGLSLVAFDTEHIKRYVFETDKLKEIRGASSLLDSLNRIVMRRLAGRYSASVVYAHGGSGLFLITTEYAQEFGQQVQQAYYDISGGGSSVTFALWPLPEHVTTIGDDDITDVLELLQWRLQEEKLHPPQSLVLASHPFMRLCDACGIEYVDALVPYKDVIHSPGEEDEQYCTSCQRKRKREDTVDREVKRFIQSFPPASDTRKRVQHDEYMWATIIQLLHDMHYNFPEKTELPSDFNVFRKFKGAKDYLGLVYADANNMGRAIERCNTLAIRQSLAESIDAALYTTIKQFHEIFYM